MAEVGKINKVKLVKQLDFGAYIDGGELGEILIPRKDISTCIEVGSDVEVLIYHDSEGRLIATTLEPLAQAGEFAMLKVVSVSDVGAFLEWGIEKDLMVPFAEQRVPMEEGQIWLVYVFVDKQSGRTVASSKLDKFLLKDVGDLKEGQEVDLMIFQQTDLGYKAVVNNCRLGVLFENEVFQPLEVGQKIKGYIKKIRFDEKIDLTLERMGYQKVDDLSGGVLSVLSAHDGFIPVTDKSDPEEIKEMFGISKKTYKKIIGALYKQKKVIIEDNGIRLIKEMIR